MGTLNKSAYAYRFKRGIKLPRGFKMVKQLSRITCPECGFAKEEVMPVDSCQFFYVCSNCGIKLKPKQGDCCVYCSYGSVKCPDKQ